MTDGPCMSLEHDSQIETTPCLHNFAAWIELQDLATYAGMLELIGNALYRQERFIEGSEVKHVVQELREHHGQ